MRVRLTALLSVLLTDSRITEWITIV